MPSGQPASDAEEGVLARQYGLRGVRAGGHFQALQVQGRR